MCRILFKINDKNVKILKKGYIFRTSSVFLVNSVLLIEYFKEVYWINVFYILHVHKYIYVSVRRTLKNGLSEEEKKHIAAYIKGY